MNKHATLKIDIRVATSALNAALSHAHDAGLCVFLSASSTDHVNVQAIGCPAKTIRTPAKVELYDIAEFQDEE